MIARRRLIDRKRTSRRRETIIDPNSELPVVAAEGNGPDTCAVPPVPQPAPSCTTGPPTIGEKRWPTTLPWNLQHS